MWMLLRWSAVKVTLPEDGAAACASLSALREQPAVIASAVIAMAATTVPRDHPSRRSAPRLASKDLIFIFARDLNLPASTRRDATSRHRAPGTALRYRHNDWPGPAPG